MRIVCYFAADPNNSTEYKLADYDKIWPVMQQSVEAQGYTLIHLTSLDDRARCAQTARIDVDPSKIMLSREIAWMRFLEQLPDGEQAALIEPDCVLRKPIPPLADDKDAMLLLRPGKPMPSGFRLATNKALRFYREVVDLYRWATPEKQVMHGDVDSIAKVLGIDRGNAARLPHSWKTVRFEHRNWTDYTSKLWRHAVAWNFKGWSKDVMIDMANGIQPELR